MHVPSDPQDLHCRRRRIEKMKLIIQIPCLNEAETLPKIISEIPKTIEGIDTIEVLVIDDGSTDGTIRAAKASGVTRVLRHTSRKGLARAFANGLDEALKCGADIIVNLDADGQYDPKEITSLIRPILLGKADMVIGARDIENLKHFSFIKKKLQRLGSFVVRMVSHTEIPDVTSGFRAFSRDAARSINVVSDFTYTIETLIQAGSQNIALSHVPIHAREVARKSRLFKTVHEYIAKSFSTIIRIYTMYKPLKVFSAIAGLLFLTGVAFFARFLYIRFSTFGARPIQNLIASGVFIILGFQVFLIGLLADLIAANRKILENALKRIKSIEYSKK